MASVDALVAVIERQPVQRAGETARPEFLAGDLMFVTRACGTLAHWPLHEVAAQTAEGIE